MKENPNTDVAILFGFLFTLLLYDTVVFVLSKTNTPIKPGIESDKKMADKLMYNDDTQNYPFNRLKFAVETFGHSTQ